MALAVSALTGPTAAADIEAGHATFLRYCASCHGEAGDGRGPIRPVLIVKPKNLTELARQNGGVFPLKRVIARIDGRNPLISHGSEMPVYGDFFREGGRAELRAQDGGRIVTSGAVADLVAWLRTIQHD